MNRTEAHRAHPRVGVRSSYVVTRDGFSWRYYVRTEAGDRRGHRPFTWWAKLKARRLMATGGR